MANPLLSNTDNVFVGQMVGEVGIGRSVSRYRCHLIDQLLYLFSFLGKATTSLVARAYNFNNDEQQGN